MKYREAGKDDLLDIIKLYSDDGLGSTREILSDPVDDVYIKAFNDIEKDPNNRIYVIDMNAQIIATLQYTIIPYLCRSGEKRAQIEAVRVHKDYRGQGIGEELINYVIEQAKLDGCSIIQLTTDKTRKDAHMFYLNSGFSDSHIGMKKYI